MPGCFPDLMSCGLFCVPGTIACQTLWPGQRDGRRLFRFCPPGTIACQTLDFFIRFRSDVNLAPAEGRQEAVSSRRAKVFS